MSSGPSIDLATYAAISADIAEGDRVLGEVLFARGVTDAEWTDATLFWSRRMGEDVTVAPDGSVRAEIAEAFSEAFAKAQDEKRPLVPLSVSEWAALVDAIDREGSAGVSLPETLKKRGLRMADYARLVRHWAKSLGREPALARQYEAARASLGRGREGV